MPKSPPTTFRPPRWPRLRLLAVAVSLALVELAPARAQQAAQAAAPSSTPQRETDALQLTPSLDLAQRLSPAAQMREPLFIWADQLSGQADIDMNARGNVELRKHSVVFKAERLHYDIAQDAIDAQGDVRVVRDGNVFSGPSLQYNLALGTGQMPQAHYAFNRTQGHGQADVVTFLSHDRIEAKNATYTTCTASPLDWFMQATDLELDSADNTGVARDGRVVFKGVTILPLPYASFPLSDARKSGFLPPTIGLDSQNGLDYAQPYYWNIAPNYDATLTPRLLQRRGVMGSAELRWLEPSFSGRSFIDYMPSDSASGGSQRWAGVFQQNGVLAPSVSYGLNLQRVSDNNWWQDFGGVDPVIGASRILPQQGQVTWSQPNGSIQASFNQWQTLQNPASPIGVPYNTQPRLYGTWQSDNYTGLQWQLRAEAARFTNSTPGLLSGDRMYINPSISRPFIAPEGFITPKLSFNSTYYRTDTAMANGATTATRNLPTFSLDSGLVFERKTRFFGHDVTQTLEPRLYYVYTPYSNQQYLPNFDSAPLDLNLSTIYVDNVFSGSDRIADANNITGGITTRFLDNATGAEYARLTLAQRVLLREQRVTLTGPPVPAGLNDSFALASVSLDPRWSANAAIDYNTRLRQLVQAAVGAQWNPDAFKRVSVAYQVQSATATQIPLKYVNTAWQWQLSNRWYSVGQANYSILDKQFNDGLLGFEYNGGCWLARIAVQRNSLSTFTASTRLLFQLELTGFSRLSVIGNPLSAFEQNIPGYQLLNQPTAPPSRYLNYE
ncbi:MAG: LPS-assembly protein LptD [Betaproteobacteria bacterium]|nr:LPS-assembly protein LptD [Betaproteobacteria bacterium]